MDVRGLRRGRFAGARWRAPAVLFALIAATPAPAQDGGDRRAGLELAEDICAECHAVHADDILITNIDAFHFYQIANTPGMTAGALRVWLRSSHPTMPNFILTAQQIDDLVAYILSLKDAR